MFTLIAYKASSYTEKADGISNSSSVTNFDSDHVVRTDLDLIGLIEVWGLYLYRNSLLAMGEDGYSFSVFKDGEMILDQDEILSEVVKPFLKCAMNNMAVRSQNANEKKLKDSDKFQRYQQYLELKREFETSN